MVNLVQDVDKKIDSVKEKFKDLDPFSIFKGN